MTTSALVSIIISGLSGLISILLVALIAQVNGSIRSLSDRVGTIEDHLMRNGKSS